MSSRAGTTILLTPPEGAEPSTAGPEILERAGGPRALLALLLLLCIVSRVASTIYYIEDTDSLRFALSMQEFSVAELQPHFPGYPVFWAAAKTLYTAVGSYAVAFSLVGAMAVFAIAFLLLRLANARLDGPAGVFIAVLVFFNPLMWLMGNRYMPDLMGLAWAMAVFHLLVVSPQTRWRRCLGMFLAGMLAGVRLSYLPFVLIPVLAALARRGERVRLVAAGSAGVLLWLIPLALDTGWSELIAAAGRQTVGHFTEFGGTVAVEPQVWPRISGLVEGVVADGLGGYWPLRHPITLFVTAGLVGALAVGAGPLRSRIGSRTRWIMAGSWVAYLVWIVLYQNVVHKSRHVLPLLPFVLLAAALGCTALWAQRRALARVAVGVFLASYAALTLVLVAQHRSPTAIAQVSEVLRESSTRRLTVVSIPLVNFYLDARGVRAHFVSVESEAELTALDHLSPDARVVTVGHFPWLFPGRDGRLRVFYHNPYVNRMWSEIKVYEYDNARR